MIEVWSISEPTLIATYAPPGFLRSDYFMVQFRLDVASTSLLDTDSTFPSSLPFVAPVEPALAALTMSVYRAVEDSENPPEEYLLDGEYWIFLRTSTFFPTPELLTRFPDKYVPWSAWGEKGARVIKSVAMDCYPSGNIYMHRFGNGNYDHDESIFVYDFDPNTLGCKSEVNDRWTLHTEVSECHDKAFMEPFKSSLPYREFRFHPHEPMYLSTASTNVYPGDYMHTMSLCSEEVSYHRFTVREALGICDH